MALSPLAEAGEKFRANQMDFILAYLGFISLLSSYHLFLFLIAPPACQWFRLGPGAHLCGSDILSDFASFCIVPFTSIKSVSLSARL